jgi:hypothetical protein
VYATAVAPDGSLWVLGGAAYAIHHFARDGTFLTRFAPRGGRRPEVADPNDLAVGSDGTVFVLDTKDRRVVHYSQTGVILSTWGSLGDGPGQFGAHAPVSYAIGGPEGIAADGKGKIFVADTYNDRIETFSEGGKFIRSFRAFDIDPQSPSSPTQLAIGPDGSVYVVGRDSSLTIYSPEGRLLWYMGGTLEPFEQSIGRLVTPSDIVVARDGRVVIANDDCTDKPQRCGYVDVFGAGGIVPAHAMPPRVATARITLELGTRLGKWCPSFAVGLADCTGLTVGTVRWSMTCTGHDARPGWAIALRTRGSAAGPRGSYRAPGFSGPAFASAPPHHFGSMWLFADGEDLGANDPRKSNVLSYASGASDTKGSRTILIGSKTRVFPVGLFVCRRHAGFDKSVWGSKPTWDKILAGAINTWQEATLEVQGAVRTTQ